MKLVIRRTVIACCGGGNLPVPLKLPGRVAVLDVSHGGNYFHFLFDCLPRLALLPPDRPPDYYYVRASRGFQKQYLRLIGIDPSRIVCSEHNPVVQVERLCLPSLPGISGNPTSATADFLRGIKSLLRPAPGRREKKMRIYISRGDVNSRLFANEEEVQQVLRRQGFTIVELSKLKVDEQINLFNRASLVVAPHGAGLSNLAFAEPGLKVVELLAATYFNVCYWAVCQLCGHHYCHLVAPPSRHRPGRLGSLARRLGGPGIPVERLLELLQRLDERV